MKPGDAVHYCPNPTDKIQRTQNGIVKSLCPHDKRKLFVVFFCGDDWGHYENYTAQLTQINHLRKGWAETYPLILEKDESK